MRLFFLVLCFGDRLHRRCQHLCVAHFRAFSIPLIRGLATPYWCIAKGFLSSLNNSGYILTPYFCAAIYYCRNKINMPYEKEYPVSGEPYIGGAKRCRIKTNEKIFTAKKIPFQFYPTNARGDYEALKGKFIAKLYQMLL